MIARFILYSFLSLVVGFTSVRPAEAVVLSLSPSSATVTAGSTVNVDVLISGLGNGGPPSAGAFDLNVAFDPSVLSSTGVTFGPFLGDPLLFEALTDFTFPASGTVEFAEVSLLSPTELDALQSSSFSLATLSFTAISNGTSSFALVGQQRVDDVFGSPLAIPEPSTICLLILGLVAVRIKRCQSVCSWEKRFWGS